MTRHEQTERNKRTRKVSKSDTLRKQTLTDLDTAIAECAEAELRGALALAASFIEKLIALGQASDAMRVIHFHNALVPILTVDARVLLGRIRDVMPSATRQSSNADHGLNTKEIN